MDMTCASGCAGISACSRASRSVRSIPHWPASRPPAQSTRSLPGMGPRIRRRAYSPLQVPSQVRGLLSWPAWLLDGQLRPDPAPAPGAGASTSSPARGDEMFHHLLETEEPKPEGGRGFALALGLRPLFEPGCPALAPSAPASPAGGRPGRLPSGGRVALATPRPVPTLAPRPCKRGDRARPELDRASHRGREGLSDLLVCAPHRGAPDQYR